ncbi:MAG: nitroreductase family protein [Acidimicrobiales bacterium]
MTSTPPPISLLDGLATTRAIRRYAPDPIPENDLSTILWHASRAPSGSNRQPFRFLVLRDGPSATAAKALLGRSFREMWASKQVEDGYGSGTGADDTSPKARMARTMQHFVDHFEDAPVVVLPCLIRYRAPYPAEGSSIYPACQNLLLAARALGYGGVMTVWHAFVEDDLRALLGIPDEVAIAATIPLGRPLGAHGPVRRRPLGELVFEDRWETPAAWAIDPDGTRFTSAGPPGGQR